MERYGLAVAGGGASGLMAALTAARRGTPVILLEGSGKPGRRLLATGNGRCNLTNLHVSPRRYHGDVKLAAPLLARWPAQRVRELFAGLGLLTRADSEGRVYPYSLQAAAVARALCSACEEAGVELRCGFPISRAQREKGGFLLSGEEGQVWARSCVLACGGQASPKLSTGSGYGLARQFGHTVTALSPSLVGLRVPAKLTRSLKGMRCRARAALCQNGRELYAESGEVIFGESSLSGICVMNSSARLRGLPPGSLTLALDLAEDFSPQELAAYLKTVCERFPNASCWELFAGLLNLRVGQEVARSLGFSRERSLKSLSAGELSQAAEKVKAFPLPVEGPLGWENAQCTAGGVPLGEVDPLTMESRKARGLFLTGELLDLDGDCGGYNLHWAWATGVTAGEAAGRMRNGGKGHA